MIIRLNKEKLALIAALILLSVVLVLYLTRPSDESDLTVSTRHTVYIPKPLREQPAFKDYHAYAVTGRNPFVSASKKAEYVVDLPLPEILIRPPAVHIMTPLPAEPFNPLWFFRLPAPTAVRTVDGLNITDPAILPEKVEIESIIDAIQKAENEVPPPKPTEPLKDDVLHFKDGQDIKGRFIKMDDKWVTFAPKGSPMVQNYPREEVSDIERAYTIEEQYQQLLARTSTQNAEGQWTLAVWCFEKGLEPEAVLALQAAITANNSALKYYQRLAEYYASRLDITREVETYHAALSAPLVNKEVIYLKLGEAYEKLGLSAESVAYYESAIKSYPSYAPAWLKMGDFYIVHGQYELAQKSYQHAKEIAPNETNLNERLAVLEFRRGNLNKAKEYLAKIETSPKPAEYNNIQGVVALLSNDYKSAVSYFIDSVKAKPADPSRGATAESRPNRESPATYSGAQVDGWLNLATFYLVSGRYEEAEILITEAIRRSPASAQPLAALAYLKWSVGLSDAGSGPAISGGISTDKIDEVLPRLADALKVDPNSFVAHYARGQFQFHSGKPEEARKDFNFCLKANTLFTETLYYLACIAYRQHQYVEAIKYYKLYIQSVQPDRSDYVNLAIAYLANQQYDMAASVLQNIKGDYAPALDCLGYLEYTAHYDIDKALKYLEDAAQTDKNDTYGPQASVLIKRAESLVVWSDNFNRTDNTDLSRGWNENEKYGITITVAGKKCLFRGVQALVENGITALERSVSRLTFVRVELELDIPSAESQPLQDKLRPDRSVGAETEPGIIRGLYLAAQTKRSALFIANYNGKLSYGVSKKMDAPPPKWKPFSEVAMPAGECRLALEKTTARDEERGRQTDELSIFLNDDLVGTIPFQEVDFLRGIDPSFIAGVFGYAPLNKKWELTVKAVRIVEEKT
ncbi:MAG: tetratricopeptide repeat protein, partial [Planctomycetes bacterium]|nr:tetratricopeptide repeat protein [Planctomycetota bacterium]